jgi:lysophospholipase L1-like esterase
MRSASILLALAAAFATSAAAAATLPAADPHIAVMGRSAQEPDGALRIAYPGVTLSLAFTGKSLSVDVASSGKDSYLEAVVDGGPPTKIHVPPQRASIVLVNGGASAHHRVDLMHRSETWHGVVTVAGFATDGVFEAAPVLASRKMLVLGDSVTCGEVIDRVPGEKNKPEWLNARASYGMLVAEALHAQVHLVCYGGRGLVRSWNGRTDEFNLPDFYELAIPDAANPAAWDHSRYEPDLILVSIGTNDFNPGIPDGAAYVRAYVGFVRTLLHNHPHAQIVLTEGAILDGEKKRALSGYIAETVARVGDRRVHAVPSMHHPGDAQDAHPTREQHAEMARELLPQLRAVMGW